MIRRIIKINEKKCNGCGACATACHEGAIRMVNGKAKLIRDDYCDGLGDCLPACPADAISFEEREAAAYDEQAVKRHLEKQPTKTANRNSVSSSQLSQWPVQIKLLPTKAPYFQNAHILIAADCTAYAYANFHQDFIKGRAVLIGCPKLDMVDYSEKLTEIFRENDIADVTVTRMQVPCCGGMEYAVKTAVQASGKEIPVEVCIISPDGNILN